jgi:dTDP-4-dehydrorhamnose reductase
MIGLERTRPEIDVVDDQRGQPTWAGDVARQIIALIRSGAAGGVYHATSSGDTTWFGLAQEVFRTLGADPARVRPVSSEAFPRPARRPSYSVLGHVRWAEAGLEPIGEWRYVLKEAFPFLLAGLSLGGPRYPLVAPASRPRT